MAAGSRSKRATSSSMRRTPPSTPPSNRAGTSCSRSPIRAWAWMKRRRPASSSRFSPRRRAAREPVWVWPRSTASCSRPAGISGPTPNPAVARRCACTCRGWMNQPTPFERPGELAPEVLRGSETILLVEDEAPVRSVTRQLLERNGYTVLEAADGPAALALMDGGSADLHVDMLLTDVIMPGMSGRELADQLKARQPA